MAKANEYSVKEGAKRAFSKTFITWLLPAVLFLLDHYTEWVPKEYVVVAAPVVGFLSYLAANYWKYGR